MKVSEIIKKINKDKDNEVYFPTYYLINELNIPKLNYSGEKLKLVDDRIKGYWLKNKVGAKCLINNTKVFFMDDEFICMIINKDFYWKDEETYFRINNILRNLNIENSRMELCDLDKEIFDTYKENNINELGMGTHGYYNGNEFKITKIYIDDEEENYIVIEFIKDKTYEIVYNNDIDKLEFCYNLI